MGMEYVGARELAQLLGIGEDQVAQVTAAEDFPAPLMDLASGPVWELADVEEWAGRSGLEEQRPPQP